MFPFFLFFFHFFFRFFFRFLFRGPFATFSLALIQSLFSIAMKKKKIRQLFATNLLARCTIVCAELQSPAHTPQNNK
jgi:hypothetical protein